MEGVLSTQFDGCDNLTNEELHLDGPRSLSINCNLANLRVTNQMAAQQNSLLSLDSSGSVAKEGSANPITPITLVSIRIKGGVLHETPNTCTCFRGLRSL